MAFAVDIRRLGAAAAAIALSAALLWLGTGMHPVWPLPWLAPLPVLVFAARSSAPGAAIAAGLAWVIGLLNLWPYLHDALHIPVPAIAMICGLPAVAFAAAVVLYRALLRRGWTALAIVALPSTWVAFEYVTAVASPNGTAGNLAYTQLAMLPVLQLASVTGPWGVSFVVMAVPAAIAAAWYVRGARAWRIVAATAIALAAVLGFGVLRLATGLGDEAVPVGLVTSDPPTSPEIAKPGPATTALLGAYGDRVAALAAQGAKAIVLPEKLAVAPAAELAALDARFQAIADAAQVTIVVGLVQPAPPDTYNEARIYAPGTAVQRYHKQHMVPGFESDLTPGTSLTQLSRPSWGVEICKDLDFAQPSRDYGRAGVGLMLAPGWDFVIDGAWHGHMAILRGVEYGFSVVRAGKQGFLTVSDNRGRIVAEVASDAAPFATLVTAVPSRHVDTLYLQLGDWFAWLALAVLGLALAALIVVKLRAASAGSAGVTEG